MSLLISARVNIIDASEGSIISTLPAENVYELGFSPLGTYIITWQRPSKDEAGDAVKNLKVWRVVEDQPLNDDLEKQTIGKFVQKNQTGWNLQYTFDERFCARVVTNEVQIYESHDLTKVWNKLRVEGVSDFTVSPGENHSIAVFVPERKVCMQLLSKPQKLTSPGFTCISSCLQCSQLRYAGLTEKFLQRRQGTAQVERQRDEPNCVGANRGGQDRQELLRRDDYVPSQRQWGLRLESRPRYVFVLLGQRTTLTFW